MLLVDRVTDESTKPGRISRRSISAPQEDSFMGQLWLTQMKGRHAIRYWPANRSATASKLAAPSLPYQRLRSSAIACATRPSPLLRAKPGISAAS
jgi:hypothetical protein